MVVWKGFEVLKDTSWIVAAGSSHPVTLASDHSRILLTRPPNQDPGQGTQSFEGDQATAGSSGAPPELFHLWKHSFQMSFQL